MSRNPFYNQEDLLREARALRDSFNGPQPVRGSQGGRRGPNRGGGRGGTRGSSNRRGGGDRNTQPLFSPSPHTSRGGVSSAFPGPGGFSSSGISSTSLFANTSRASTTQRVAVTNEPQSATSRASMTPSIGGPSHTSTIQRVAVTNGLQNATGRTSMTPSIVGPSQNTQPRAESSSVTTTIHQMSTPSYDLAASTARGQGTGSRHGGISNSRFSSANSQAATVHQPVHPVAPAASPSDTTATVTASPQPVHTSDDSASSDVEMEEVEEFPRRHGGLSQSRFAGQPSVAGQPSFASQPRWIPARVLEPTTIPQHLQEDFARLNSLQSQQAEPSSTSSTSNGVSHGTRGGSQLANAR